MTGNSVNRKFFSYVNLGCKLNFAEISYIGNELIKNGYSIAGKGDVPDVCIINTCSVTSVADKKSRQAIKKMIRKYPEAVIAVLGCYAQLKPEEVKEIDGVDIVLGTNEKFDIIKYLNDLDYGKSKIVSVSPLKDIKIFSPSYSKGDRTRYFLKVQDGCDYFCTYCTIPYARGRSRNAPISELVCEAGKIADAGGKEIVISGVNIGDFGKTTGENLCDLLKELDKVDGIERYRISSIEPDLLTDEIIEFVAASEKFVPHFHIPLQSGSDDVLKLMHRRYNCNLFASKVCLIKKFMPDAFIGVDIIAGCRGETDAYFNDSLEFVKSLDISRLHVFTYSERPGTSALNIEYKVPPGEKKRRHELLESVSDEKLNKFYISQIGHIVNVLFEHPRAGGMMHGFSENYIKAEAAYDKKFVNKTIKCKLGGFNNAGDALTIEKYEK